MKFIVTTDSDQYNGSAVKNKAIAAAQTSVATMQDALQSGLSTAQDVLGKNVKRANKNVKRAQKKGKSTQASVLSSAQDVLTTNVKLANKNLKKTQKSIKNIQGSVQDQLASYSRKRKHARVMFRLGLLVGVALALMYTPWPGAYIRQQLVALWQQMFQ